MNTLNPRKTTVVKFGETVELTVSEATAEVGVYRTILIQNEYDNQKAVESTERDSAAPVDLHVASLRVLRTMMYPSMIAAVVEQKGFTDWPPSFEEFKMLPEMLIVDWEVATFDLNPHWRPAETPKAPKAKAAARKKRTGSTSG